MSTEQFIAADKFCEFYNIELSFINSLHDHGLIEVSSIEEKRFIAHDKLQELEQFIHLHYDLDINVEGIDAIAHLLQRVKDLQRELSLLQNKLRVYE
jgi:hypothetical protein